MVYTLREGCEAPVQPAITADDRKHPQYARYLKYRAAMSEQLVRCPNFSSWLLMMSAGDGL